MSDEKPVKNDADVTLDELKQFHDYMEQFDKLMQEMPEPLSVEIWDAVVDEMVNNGSHDIPDKYKGIVSYDSNGKLQDTALSTWQKKYTKLNSKYNKVVIKLAAYSAAHKGETLSDLIDRLKAEQSNLPVINEHGHSINSADFPLDKINKDIWNLLDIKPNGQIQTRYDVSNNCSKEPVDILFSLDFDTDDTVKITKKLEPYDKRVYIAVAALYYNGMNVVSIQQIYNAMGYSGNASKTDVKKINNSITKMNIAHLYVDNLQESKAYRYDRFKYDSSLLPVERIQAIINGQTVEAAIHIFREPPMISFARARKQITTINIKILDTPLSKTNANIALEDYLIEEISHIKKGRIKNKMLYETIYKNAGITTKKQKQRAPEKINKLLNHYKNCNFIKNFTESKEGITIKF